MGVEIGMLIDTNMTMAYKCSECGTFEFFNIYVFELLKRENLNLTCRCKKSDITICPNGSSVLKARVPCFACGEDHEFAFRPKEMLNRDIMVLCCPHTGIQLCFIGNDIKVRAKIDTLEQEQDELINNLGYDDYFKNTRVMFDSINHIHDIAEKGNLICECGNDHVELVLLSDTIQLKCSKCPGSVVLSAASNEDLKYILRTQQIYLRQLQHTI